MDRVETILNGAATRMEAQKLVDEKAREMAGEQPDPGTRTLSRIEELEERNAHLQEKLRELGEEHRQAQSLLQQQQSEIIRLRAEMYEYHLQVIGAQNRELERLKGSSAPEVAEST